MLAMTWNVAKTFPPAIIYLDEAEQIFKGKKKKKKTTFSINNLEEHKEESNKPQHEMLNYID